MGNLANSEDPDEMQHHAAFHQGLHCLLRLKQSSGTDIHHNIENTTCYPLKYTMGSPILIVPICMGKSIRMQRVFSVVMKKDISKLSSAAIEMWALRVNFHKILINCQLSQPFCRKVELGPGTMSDHVCRHICYFRSSQPGYY